MLGEERAPLHDMPPSFFFEIHGSLSYPGLWQREGEGAAIHLARTSDVVLLLRLLLLLL